MHLLEKEENPAFTGRPETHRFEGVLFDMDGTLPFGSIFILICITLRVVRHVARAACSVDISHTSSFAPEMSNADSGIRHHSRLNRRNRQALAQVHSPPPSVVNEVDGTCRLLLPVRIGKELGVDPAVILQTSHGRRSIDTFQLYDASKANWDCEWSSFAPFLHTDTH